MDRAWRLREGVGNALHRLIQVVVPLLIGAAVFGSALAGEDRADKNGALYRSPYDVKLPRAVKDLIPDLVEGDRGDPRLEARMPENTWYDHSRTGPWGPLPRQYLPPSIAALKTDDWKRARIIATALCFVGYGYRHHHIPDWDPPQRWYMPKTGSFRHDGRGSIAATSFLLPTTRGLVSASVPTSANRLPPYLCHFTAPTGLCLLQLFHGRNLRPCGLPSLNLVTFSLSAPGSNRKKGRP